ncbi:hypothetical protein M9Y10_022014 [Tritrichomonas musculus]|uniref:DOCKER domain-containing protein n=1 Tax=Tritrichomonas musculus TaxID=1915356 RepID=A0ABR2KRC9_9EUKA
MNKKVQDDIQELSSKYHYSWLDPIIQVNNDVQNPYFDETQNKLNLDSNYLQSPIGGIFAQHENTITFTFNDYSSTDSNKEAEAVKEAVEEIEESKQIEFSQFITRTQSLTDIINSNSVLKFSSSFNLQTDLQDKPPPMLGFTTKATVKMDKMECPFEFVEPIMFSAFLYNLKSKSIISEVWNFFPEQSAPFLKDYSPDLNSFQSASFEIDTFKNFSITLFVFASHPVTRDRGQAAINYYFNPNSDTAQLVKKEKAKFPNLQISTFSAFAFTFFDFKSVSSSKLPQQNKFYVFDKLPFENPLSQLQSDVNARRLKTIGLKLFMCQGDGESELIVRQISNKRPQPYFSPINRAVLRIDKLTTSQAFDPSSSTSIPIDCGYAVKVECLENENPIEAIRSNCNPAKFVEYEMTKLCFPPSSPNLNELFVINLPYPLTPSCVMKFTLYKCNFSSSEKGKDKGKFIEEIGSTNFPFLDDDVLIDETPKSITFPGEHTLVIRLFSNSNAYVYDKNLNSFLSSNENAQYSLLHSVSPSNLVTFLYPILNQFIRKTIIHHDQEFVEEFIKMCNMITTVIDNNSLSTFFLAFVRFFAFTTTEIENAKKLSTPVPIPNVDLSNNAQMNPMDENQPEIDIIHISFSQLQFHQKLFVLLTNFLTAHPDGIDILAPYFDFFFTLITKYICLDKDTQKIFSDEFGIFTLQFIKFALKSNNLSQLVRSYAIFVNLLYDSGYADIAIIAVKNFLTSWPDTSNSINESEIYTKSKNDFIETLFRPSIFALLVKNSKEFQNIVIGLIRNGYDSIATSPEPSRLFEILLQLTQIYDQEINQIISSELVEATIFFKPNLFFNKDHVFPPLIYFIYLLLTCRKAPSNKRIFEGLHFLLTKVSKQDIINETKVSFNADLSQKENSPMDTKRRTKKSGTFVSRKKNNELQPELADLQNANQAFMQKSKDKKKSKLFMNYTNKSIFDLIVKLEQSDDAQIPSIISLIFHLVIMTKEIEPLEKMIFILKYYMQKFKMKFINTTSPALARILLKLFNLSIAITMKEVKMPALPPLRQQKPENSGPASSRTRARATSFTAAKIASLENQGKSEYNEAPENTSFRQNADKKNRTPFNPSELEQPKKSAADISAAYQSEIIQVPTSFNINNGNNDKKRRTTFAKMPDGVSQSMESDQSSNVDQSSLNTTQVSPLESEPSNNTSNPEEDMNRINSVIAEFIESTFSVDFECNNNNNRSSAIFMRALSSLTEEQLTSKNIENLLLNHVLQFNSEQTNNKALNECIEIYKQIYEIAKKIRVNTKSKQFTYEEHSELLFKLVKLFAKSPDAQVEYLEKLYDLHMSEGSDFEAANVSIVQAAIIFENLTVWHKIPNYFRLSHPCFVFKDICTICGNVQCPDEYRKDPPLVPGFCDSFMFNEQGFISLLYRSLDICSKNKILKLASMLIDLCWPIFEYWQSFNELQVMFSKFHDIFSSLVEDAEGQDAFADRFFRVTFFGQKLDESNQKTYIYRQKPLTHLYDFTNNIMTKYAEIYGKDSIVQISESGKVDTSKLDLVRKVYIQITFVEPYTHGSKDKGKNGAEKVKTDLYTHFFYDTPFVKSDDNSADTGKAHQATMDKQWIRKTILPTNFELPSLLIRSEVNPSLIVEKDSEPIKVVCKQIRDRTKQLEKAIESNDMMKTQQLLHGSLLVQVNEGPARIADVFLGDETKNKSKGADNLRDAFILFMRQLRKGVSVHEQLTAQNPEFQPLQEELEAGYESLKNKLAPLCIKNPLRTSLSTFASTSAQILNAANQMSNLNLTINENSSSSSIIDPQANHPPASSSPFKDTNANNANGNPE